MKDEKKSPEKDRKGFSFSHPVLEYSKEMQIDYIFIIGLMAAVDGIISDEERDYINELCDKLKIDLSDREEIMVRIRCYSEDIINALKPFCSTEIRFSLIWDLIIMEYADGVIMEEETAYLKKIAKHLKVKQKQVDFMIKLMEQTGKRDSLEVIKQEFAEQLKKLEIPIQYILF